MSETPISDRAMIYVSLQDYRSSDAKKCVPIEICQELEKITNVLYKALKDIDDNFRHTEADEALTVYEILKKGKA